jgi:hypothetical protein
MTASVSDVGTCPRSAGRLTQAERPHVRPDLVDVIKALRFALENPSARQPSGIWRSASYIEYCSSWFTTTL